MTSEIYLRFYEELNDFLPPNKRKRRFVYLFEGVIQAEKLLKDFEVPLGLVEMVLVNGDSVKISHLLKNGDTVSIYPVFESLDVGPLVRLREKPLRQLHRNRFLVDTGLNRLTAYLRLFGFDTWNADAVSRENIIRVAEKDRRILLTSNAALIKDPLITRIHLVRQKKPRRQLEEILSRYDLYGCAVPYSRCPSCNKIVQECRDWSCSDCGKKNRNAFRTKRLQLLVDRTLSDRSVQECSG